MVLASGRYGPWVHAVITSRSSIGPPDQELWAATRMIAFARSFATSYGTLTSPGPE
ncbi:hypothetical protein STVIR_4885 [Streptomyces viridochromogenes Tue57]|uniref:Uncharacterized protein n=1 Tax=Streptomyces viridochromogenes Tue57 TaxID=1160705 RepID=L8PCF4_STRVR|nr:hypothetical protein STVIR_4885 [Streptomyces viridochromogenes Tue57]